MARTFGSIQFELSHFVKAQGLPGVDLELTRNWINEAYNGVLDKRQWKRLESRAILTTTAAYRTGTVSATNGSTTITGSGTTWTASMSGRRIRIIGRMEAYTFTYVSATSGTLSRAFEGETVTGAGFEIFQNLYTLPSRVKMITLMRNPRTDQPMHLITEENLDQVSASRMLIGEPIWYSPSTDSGDPPGVVSQVEIYPASSDAIGISYSYLRLPIEFTGANTSDEIMPWVDPRAVIAGAKSLMLSHFKDYAGAAAENAIADSAYRIMSQVETDTVGPSKLRMAARFTRHRNARGQWGA